MRDRVDMPCADAPPVRFEPELFHVAAHGALARHPLIRPGLCLNPACSREFAPRRDWQVYCCAGCREAGEREFRRVGHRIAPAVLAWQMGRYAKPGPLAELSRAGRRYYSSVAGDWLRDRQARIAWAGNQRGVDCG